MDGSYQNKTIASVNEKEMMVKTTLKILVLGTASIFAGFASIQDIVINFIVF
jgi:hypothetical protein